MAKKQKQPELPDTFALYGKRVVRVSGMVVELSCGHTDEYVPQSLPHLGQLVRCYICTDKDQWEVEALAEKVFLSLLSSNPPGSFLPAAAFTHAEGFIRERNERRSKPAPIPSSAQ